MASFQPRPSTPPSLLPSPPPHRQEDFYRILTEPETNMIRQQQALMATEDVELHFTDAAIK